MLGLKIIDKISDTNIDKWRNFFQKTEYWTREELKSEQIRLLKPLIKHCYDTVPYYNKLFKQMRLSPLDFRTISDLQKLPIVRKEDVKKNPRLFLSSKINLYKTIQI